MCESFSDSLALLEGEVAPLFPAKYDLLALFHASALPRIIGRIETFLRWRGEQMDVSEVYVL